MLARARSPCHTAAAANAACLLQLGKKKGLGLDSDSKGLAMIIDGKKYVGTKLDTPKGIQTWIDGYKDGKVEQYLESDAEPPKGSMEGMRFFKQEPMMPGVRRTYATYRPIGACR